MLESAEMAVENAILQDCPSCGLSLDTTEAEPLSRVACPKCGEKIRVARSFNNFVLLETLGVGGMGTVYKARDTLLDRLVALKLLRKDLGAGVDQTAQLQQEARVAASVNHPNVIQVFSSGTDHGQFYLVMELVDRGSLDDFIEERKHVPEEQVLETGIQVAKGLRAAYAKGLIHRDVKPPNILFADEHTAKIGDFGLAGVTAEHSEGGGEIWGTPYYVAPERLKNEPEDFRSDIYSLGATLFHAAAGEAPIEGDTNSATELLSLKNKPRDLRQIAPATSVATARVLHRMIAPDPNHRFGSYDELVRELERAQQSLGGKRIDGDHRPNQRVWWVVAGTALLIVLIAAGLVISRKSREREAAHVSTSSTTRISDGELEKKFADARHELVREHHRVAHAAFALIALQAKDRRPMCDWLRLNEGLAALVGREQSQAQQAFQEVASADQIGVNNENAEAVKSARATAQRVLDPNVIPADASEHKQNPFAPLLFALKDISKGDAVDASILLERFINSQASPQFRWIADYKPLAQKYLADCREYIAWQNEPKTTDAKSNLQKVQATKGKLKMAGALRDAVNAAEKTLQAQVNEQQKSENAAQQATKTQLEQTAQKKQQWILEWKAKLIDDLNRRHFSGAVTDVAGVQYSGIESATGDKLIMKIPFGALAIDWNKLSTKTLLAISASFIQPNAADTASRQWLCAVYASETGQTEAARQFAESAAKSNPQYRDLIQLVVR